MPILDAISFPLLAGVTASACQEYHKTGTFSFMLCLSTINPFFGMFDYTTLSHYKL